MTPREELIAKIEQMSDEQVESLLRYAKTLEIYQLPASYDPDNDPAVGFISGPTDLAERTEEILWSEFGINKTDKTPT